MSTTLAQSALDYHAADPVGKVGLAITKPCETQQDLSLAYTPGVAEPVRAIAKDPDLAYQYTAKRNLVAVITDGSAVLGLGNVGSLASKPVMEGKCVLFKRFAGVDAFDIEVNAATPDEFVETVARIAVGFGGINLEDIAAPHCFEIEKALQDRLDIPVFHDDQHGTAIIVAAALLNGLEIQGHTLGNCKVVCLGAGAAGIATLHLLEQLGLPKKNISLVDRQGVIHQQRESLPSYKAAFAQSGERQTLQQALEGAHVFIGVSGANLVKSDWIKTMAKDPLVFALANPDPEIHPNTVAEVRTDALMATGRSDYPNQVNNVLGFPFIFRGALDTRASTVSVPMRIAAVHALRALAKEPVPEVVLKAYNTKSLQFGRHYILPKPLDPRLIEVLPPAIAQAAIDSGVARSAYQPYVSSSRSS